MRKSVPGNTTSLTSTTHNLQR